MPLYRLQEDEYVYFVCRCSDGFGGDKTSLPIIEHVGPYSLELGTMCTQLDEKILEEKNQERTDLHTVLVFFSLTSPPSTAAHSRTCCQIVPYSKKRYHRLHAPHHLMLNR